MAFRARAMWIAGVVAFTCAAATSAAFGADTVYVLNSVSSVEGTVSQFGLDGAGALVARDPFKVGVGAPPSAVAVSPDGASVYVATVNGGGIFQYSVNADGTLNAKTPPKQSSGSSLNGIAVNPDGHSVYAVDASTPGTIYQYDVLAGGVLAPKMPATVAAGGAGGGIAVSPDGNNVYVAANSGGPQTGMVLQYSVGVGGALVPKSAPFVTAGAGTLNVAVNPDGKSVYASNSTSHTVSQYDVNPDGTLAAKSTPTVATSQAPWKFAISKDGTSVYVTGFGANQAVDDGSVSQFSVGADGGLSPKSPAAVPSGPHPRGAALSTDGAHLYVTNTSNTANPSKAGVFQYDVGAGGTLAPKSPSLVASGNQPDGIAITPIGTPPGGGGLPPPGPQFPSLFDTVITSGPSGLTPSLPTFTFETLIANATFECRFDNRAFRPC